MDNQKSLFHVLVSLVLLLLFAFLGLSNGSCEVHTGKTRPLPKPQWRQFAYDGAKTGQSPYEGPQTNKLKWQFALPGWGSNVVIGADGTAYVGTHSGVLFALNPDGREKWRFELPMVRVTLPADWPEAEKEEIREAGGIRPSITAGLAIGADGTLYFGDALHLFQISSTEGYALSGYRRHLYALGEEGTLKWKFPIGQADVATHITLGTDGTIYFGTVKGKYKEAECRFHAVNPDGTMKWERLLSRSGSLLSAATAGDGTVYVGGDTFRALDPKDGSTKWELDIQTTTSIAAAPAVAHDGTVYVCTPPWPEKDHHRLFAINPDGTKKWDVTVGAMETSPAIAADGTIYITSWVTDDAQVEPGIRTGLTAITPDGRVKWSYETRFPVWHFDPEQRGMPWGSDSSPIVGADGIVYFGTDAGLVYAVNPNGTLKWKFGAGGEFDNCPSVDAKGTLYICHSGGPGEITSGKLKCYAISDEGGMTLPVTTPGKPVKGSDEAVASALKDVRVKELLERYPRAKPSPYFSDEHGVWIIEFIQGGREVGVATVRKDGRVAEVEAEQIEEQEHEAVELEQEKGELETTRGEYLGHKWRIDENHLMWWDDKPYVPFGGFGIEPGNEFGLNTFNLWIDFDPFIEKRDYTRAQHRRDVAAKLDAITKAGGTCIVQFSMALPHIPEGPEPGMRWREPKGGIDGSQLSDPRVKRAIIKVWEYYAPAVRKECVRAVVLWNEINVWRWPERRSAEQYGQLLGEYAREAKRLIGDLPVCFKTAETWNAAAPIAGAAVADGLGFDVWFREPEDDHARRQIRRAISMLESRQKKTSWFFIAEGGRGIAEGGTDDEPPVESYWDRWPPFRSKEEARGILRAYALAGAKGFIYNGPTSKPGTTYRSSYRWLGVLQSEIVDLVVDTKRPLLEQPPGITSERAIHAARADERVQGLLKEFGDIRAEAEFSEQWKVWLVHFFVGDRRVGFASVGEEGQVLEVGGVETDDVR